MFGSTKAATPMGATSFLRGNDKMAALMPAITRMMSLQKDCADALPAMFRACAILSFEESQLVLATPNAAVASKLKQQLPKLQSNLQQRGWQVEAIRLKVQVIQDVRPETVMRSLELPGAAVNAFDQLSATLESTPQNSALVDALRRMVQKRR